MIERGPNLQVEDLRKRGVQEGALLEFQKEGREPNILLVTRMPGAGEDRIWLRGTGEAKAEQDFSVEEVWELREGIIDVREEVLDLYSEKFDREGLSFTERQEDMAKLEAEVMNADKDPDYLIQTLRALRREKEQLESGGGIDTVKSREEEGDGIDWEATNVLAEEAQGGISEKDMTEDGLIALLDSGDWPPYRLIDEVEKKNKGLGEELRGAYDPISRGASSKYSSLQDYLRAKKEDGEDGDDSME